MILQGRHQWEVLAEHADNFEALAQGGLLLGLVRAQTAVPEDIADVCVECGHAKVDSCARYLRSHARHRGGVTVILHRHTGRLLTSTNILYTVAMFCVLRMFAQLQCGREYAGWQISVMSMDLLSEHPAADQTCITNYFVQRKCCRMYTGWTGVISVPCRRPPHMAESLRVTH